MEVAGLVLGAIPIVIWAHKNYARPFEELDNDTSAGEAQANVRQIGPDRPSDEELEECLKAEFPAMAEHLYADHTLDVFSHPQSSSELEGR